MIVRAWLRIFFLLRATWSTLLVCAILPHGSVLPFACGSVACSWGWPRSALHWTCSTSLRAEGIRQNRGVIRAHRQGPAASTCALHGTAHCTGSNTHYDLLAREVLLPTSHACSEAPVADHLIVSQDLPSVKFYPFWGALLPWLPCERAATI